MRQPSSTVPGTAAADVVPERVQRRTVGVLSGSVALAGLGVTVGITVGGLIARDVAGTDSAAGLGSTAGVLGAAVLAVPLARISDRAGRRAGLAAGYGVAVLGAGVTVAAAAISSLPLLLLGLFAFGASTACGLQSRYAAADLATPARRGRDLSLVVWATTVGSVLGPNLAGPGADLGRALGLPALGGAFVVSAVAFTVVAVALLLLLRPDPLLLARRLGGGGNGPRPRQATGAAMRAVWASPQGRLGLTAVIVAHSVMVGVMVMTPVHMGHAGGSAGSTLRVIGLVISVHVAGMYLFSPLVGILADRAGRRNTVAVSGALLLAAAGVAGTAAPGAAVQLGVGLLLLGLGWSCGLIAGSTLVTESVGADVRPTAQGGTDLLMGLGSALAGVLGGPLLALGGFGLVSGVSAALVLPLAVVWIAGVRSAVSGPGSS
ncbi:MFS transporter [Blastococcus mobilis]|uniref:MFS transporter n=1 Tax=Blastococcus mobilis TaxID=1938746 RepID=UPI0020CFBE2A|nr:MFS transporter [Blastococcus mobilis]